MVNGIPTYSTVAVNDNLLKSAAKQPVLVTLHDSQHMCTIKAVHGSVIQRAIGKIRSKAKFWCNAQVRSWEALEVNWTAAKTRHFQACYWMAWLLAGCFQITFFFLYFGKPLLARLFAEPMVCDEPILCASPVLPSCVYGLRQLGAHHSCHWMDCC